MQVEAARPVWRMCETDTPRPCSRVVILYEDGSGAYLGFWTGDTLIDSDGDEYGWAQEAGRLWAYLPSGFELWCEMRSDEPLSFPVMAEE